MAVAVNTSGSQTATISTEHTLATVTDANVYLVAIDVANLVGGSTPDIVVFRIYGKARSSDTERLIGEWSLMGAQTQALWLSAPITTPHHIKVTLQQTQGTGRAFPWALYEIQ